MDRENESKPIKLKIMKSYKALNVHQKIQIKQYAINIYGKRWHTRLPNFLSKLNELQIYTILN